MQLDAHIIAIPDNPELDEEKRDKLQAAVMTAVELAINELEIDGVGSVCVVWN